MGDKKPTYEDLERQIENLKKQLEAKDQIIRSENKTKTSFLDHMLEGCQIIDKDWRYYYINKSSVTRSGLQKNKLIGNKITDVWPGFKTTELYQHMKDCMENGTPKRTEIPFKFSNGKISWYDLSIQRIPEGLFILSIDITDKKKLANTLTDKNKKFQIVFENSNVAKSITHITGELDVNQAFCDMLGYTKKELQERKWQDITPKEDIAQTEKKLEEILNGRINSLRLKKRYIQKNGHYVWADVNVVMHRDKNNKPLFFITTIIDITKQKEAEELIRYQKELLEEMAKIAKIGAWEFDPNSGKGTWSDETARIHDLEPGVETNVELGISFYKGESLKKINKAIKEAIEKKKSYELELELISAKGNRKWVRTHGKPIIKNNQVVKVRGSFQDITERKLILEKLRKNENSMKNLLANLPGLVYRCKNNKEWEMEFLSDGCFNLTGYKQNELLHNSKKSFNDIIHPEDQEMVWNKIQEALQKNKPFEIEYRLLSKDNKTKWVWERGKTTSDSNNEIIEGFITEITMRKIAEEEKHKYLSFLETVFEQSPFPMWFSDTNGTAIRTNKSLRKALNATDKDIVGVYNLFNDKNLVEQGYLDKVEAVFHKKKTTRFILKWDSKKVDNFGLKTIFIWIDITLFPIINQKGELINVVCQWLDITEQKNTENQIRENEKRLMNAQKIAKIGDYIWDIEKDKIDFSNSLKNILGYNKSESFNLNFVRKNIHHPEDTNKIMLWMQNNLKSTSSILTPFEYRALKKDGTPIYVRALGIIKRSNKKPTHVITTIQDITEYKLAELEINKLNKELEERVKERTSQLEFINRELKTFTYTVSHDLKAPLRGIDGYSRLLQESYYEKLDEEGKFFVSNIREGTQQMNQLIDDLLTYSRLERSAITITEIQGKELINKLLQSYHNEIELNNLRIKTDFDDFKILADYNSLSMALRNILDNAVKFSKKVNTPEVTIGYYENNNKSTIYIKDNGIGFDQKYHNKIFEIFHRLQRVENYPGTGIGLALVNKAINRLGGRVYAESEPGKGATFYLELQKN